MRAIDADVLEKILSSAIESMRKTAKILDEEDDPEIRMEIKSYADILNGVKQQPTIEPQRTGKRMESDWIPAKTTADGWTILDGRIDRKMSILVTYKTASGRRYVKQVEVGANGSVGYVSKKLNGKITAWMPLPTPYEGE